MPLRPVDTTFDLAFVPSMTSTDSSWHVWTYRVAAHVEVSDGAGGVRTTESLEPLRLQRYPSLAYMRWCGSYMPVPPSEVLPLLDAGWQALAAHAAKP